MNASAIQSPPALMSDKRLIGRPPADLQHEQLLLQGRRLVAQTFYGTLLKQMRNSPFKSQLFSGGRGGDAFTPMLDQRLAERMTRGPGAKLAESIVRRLEGRRAYEQHSKARNTPAQRDARNHVGATGRA